MQHAQMQPIVKIREISFPVFQILEKTPVLLTTTNYSEIKFHLTKMYFDEIKYSDENNSFDYKLTIFYDVCITIDIINEIKITIFLIMLKKFVLNYYYSNIRT